MLVLVGTANVVRTFFVSSGHMLKHAKIMDNGCFSATSCYRSDCCGRGSIKTVYKNITGG